MPPIHEDLFFKKLKIPVLSQPVSLGRQVPVQDITFGVLKTPGNDNDNIPFADPGAFFYLALDPAHPLDAIMAADADMVCAHHEVGAAELFVLFLFRQPDADNRGSVRIEFRGTARTARFFYVIMNADISEGVNQWCVA